MYYFGFKGCSGLIANFCENFYWKLNQKWDASDLDDDDDDDDDDDEFMTLPPFEIRQRIL